MTAYFRDIEKTWLNSIEKLPEKLRVDLREAYSFATKEHEGQSRKGQRERPHEVDPYIIHPLRVSLIVMNEIEIADRSALLAAILHDVIEDGVSRPKVKDLASKFGAEVAEAVDALSKPEEFNTGTHDPELLRPYHESFFHKPLYIRLVKLSDRLDNLRESLLVDRPKFQFRYLRETRDVYLPLAQQTSFFFHAKLSQLCDSLENYLKTASNT